MQLNIFLIVCFLIVSMSPISNQYKFGLRSFIIKDLKILRDMRLAYELEEQRQNELERLREEETRREQEQMDEMRRKIIEQYLTPRTGPTSVLSDFYSRF